MLPFETSEYHERIRQAKTRMAQQGFDTLLVADPANMNYLTGYDGWSFYTPQLVIVAQDRKPSTRLVKAMRPALESAGDGIDGLM